MSDRIENSIKKKIPSENKIPMVLKVIFTLFTSVLVWFYWKEYGPTNFFYFCDVALFLTLAAVWTEKPIYASMAAVGITIPQIMWQVDFLSMLFNFSLVGMTKYMFNSNITLFARGLSFFHFWLPILLLFLVYKLGYDRRAFKLWTVIAWGLLLICFFLLPATADKLNPNLPHNVNYVFGMDGPQTWMNKYAWFGLLLVGLPTLIYLPTHFVLNKLWGEKPEQSEAITA